MSRRPLSKSPLRFAIAFLLFAILFSIALFVSGRWEGEPQRGWIPLFKDRVCRALTC